MVSVLIRLCENKCTRRNKHWSKARGIESTRVTCTARSQTGLKSETCHRVRRGRGWREWGRECPATRVKAKYAARVRLKKKKRKKKDIMYQAGTESWSLQKCNFSVKL